MPAIHFGIETIAFPIGMSTFHLYGEGFNSAGTIAVSVVSHTTGIVWNVQSVSIMNDHKLKVIVRIDDLRPSHSPKAKKPKGAHGHIVTSGTGTITVTIGGGSGTTPVELTTPVNYA